MVRPGSVCTSRRCPGRPAGFGEPLLIVCVMVEAVPPVLVLITEPPRRPSRPPLTSYQSLPSSSLACAGIAPHSRRAPGIEEMVRAGRIVNALSWLKLLCPRRATVSIYPVAAAAAAALSTEIDR
eukprot:UN17919